MSVKKLDVAIIGAGTAGLSARAEVAKRTDNYRLFDGGPLGTTCARVGCMPSKALIEAANEYHRRHVYDDLGITGGGGLGVDLKEAMRQVRKLRDGFVGSVKDGMADWRETHLIREAAHFDQSGRLIAGDLRFQARRTIIATGSSPIAPKDWRDRFGDRIVTTDEFFELETLPGRMAVIGLGPIGLELGQALARLGIEVLGVDTKKSIGGLSDPEVQKLAIDRLGREFRIAFGEAGLEHGENGAIRVSWEGGSAEVDCVLAAVGRRPNLGPLKLEHLGVETGKGGVPDFDRSTLRIGDSDLFIAGDVSGERAVLHEASDSGRIAGYNAVRKKPRKFRRRVSQLITFCDPQIAQVGENHDALEARGAEFVTGAVSFQNQGRAVLARNRGGLAHVYAEKAGGRILGAEMFAPRAEHFAHLLSQALEQKATLRDLLLTPYYHPVYEEGLRSALRDAAARTDSGVREVEALRCADAPVESAVGG